MLYEMWCYNVIVKLCIVWFKLQIYQGAFWSTVNIDVSKRVIHKKKNWKQHCRIDR